METFDNDNLQKKERQIENLINVVENHTRTKRHLEQYSNIGNIDNKENAKKIQEVREQQIHNLKNQIKGINENQSKENQLENTIEKYINTSGYITKNGEDLSDEQLRNMQRKQENRKVQIKNLEEE